MPQPSPDAVAEATPQPATTVAAEPVRPMDAAMMKTARNSYRHFMRKLKRPMTHKEVEGLTLQELTEKTTALKAEHEAAVEKGNQERAALALKKQEEKAANKAANALQKEAMSQEAQERKERTVWYTFDSNEILEKVRAMSAAKGELEFCKMVVVQGMGKMPGIQVRYKESSAAQAMSKTNSEAVPFNMKIRMAPQTKRAISFFLPAEVAEKISRGGQVYAATMALTAAKVEGITNVSWNLGQITVEFETEASADKGLEVIKGGLVIEGTKLELADARKGMAKRRKNRNGPNQPDGANKKRKVE